jgi:hypothetical protein
MYSWNGRLYALHKVNGEPDSFVQVDSGSQLWTRSQPAGMLQHILAQASRTQRSAPFTVTSAPTTLLPAAPATPAMCAEESRRAVSRDGEDAGRDSAAVAAKEQAAPAEEEEEEEQAEEDTEEELARTLDEILPPEFKAAMAEGAERRVPPPPSRPPKRAPYRRSNGAETAATQRPHSPTGGTQASQPAPPPHARRQPRLSAPRPPFPRRR